MSLYINSIEDTLVKEYLRDLLLLILQVMSNYGYTNYLMREVERIILFFQNLVSGLTVDNFEVEIRKFNSVFLTNF